MRRVDPGQPSLGFRPRRARPANGGTLPIDRPEAFFKRLSSAFDAVVIDHFIGGDGSPDGARTRRTPLPIAMQAVLPGSVDVAYRDEMIALARRHASRVGVGQAGFAGRYLA